MLDQKLLKKVLMNKTAYAPPMPPMGGDPMAGGGMPQDPAMMAAGMPPGGAPMGGGGAPPMDPAMMGGAPMDPAMMGGAPTPPMDPAMVGGLPGPGGGAPPTDPAMGGMPPVQLSAEDLQMLIEQAAAGAAAGGEAAPGGEVPEEAMPPAEGEGLPEEEDSRVTNKELLGRVDSLESMLGQIMASMNIAPDEGMMGMDPSMMPGAEGADATAAMATEDAIPETFAAPGGAMMPPPGLPEEGVMPMDLGPKVASDSRGELSKILSQLNTYR
jgi:hypothetical protein